MLRVVWHCCLMGQFPCFAWLLLLCTVTRQMQNYVVWHCVCVCMKLKNYICVYSQFSSLPAYFRTIVTFWVDRWMANCVCGTFPTRRLRCGTRWAGPPSWSLRPISASTDALLSLGRTMDDAFSTIRTWVPWVDFLVTVSYETHTHPFNGPLSGTTQVSRYQKGKNQSGFYWSKRQWVAVASAEPYASLHLAPVR